MRARGCKGELFRPLPFSSCCNWASFFGSGIFHASNAFSSYPRARAGAISVQRRAGFIFMLMELIKTRLCAACYLLPLSIHELGWTAILWLCSPAGNVDEKWRHTMNAPRPSNQIKVRLIPQKNTLARAEHAKRKFVLRIVRGFGGSKFFFRDRAK